MKCINERERERSHKLEKLRVSKKLLFSVFTLNTLKNKKKIIASLKKGGKIQLEAEELNDRERERKRERERF